MVWTFAALAEWFKSVLQEEIVMAFPEADAM
jgi:hypothetical protein